MFPFTCHSAQEQAWDGSSGGFSYYYRGPAYQLSGHLHAHALSVHEVQHQFRIRMGAHSRMVDDLSFRVCGHVARISRI